MSYDLTPSEDMRQIEDAARAMLASHYPVPRAPDSIDDLTPLEDFGTFALALPEDMDGAGFSVVEEAQLHVAFGQHLVTPAALATAIARRLDPTVTACLAMTDGDDALAVDPRGTHALIRSAGGVTLAPLPDVKPVSSFGDAGPMARFTPIPDAAKADLRLAQLLTAAQLLGVAIGARDLAVEYAKTREQFGRPIGSFQAIKHHAANMSLGIEQVSALLDMAAIALRDEDEFAGFHIGALARLAPRVALANARLGIQIHGGIGFSAEAAAHLYLKQAHILRQFMGTGDLLRQSAPLAPY